MSARRILSGLTFVRDNLSGDWHTEDGEHLLTHQSPGTTECDSAHPIRTSRDRGGGYCRGGETHELPAQWCAGSRDPRVDSDAHAWWPTMAEAAACLADVLNADMIESAQPAEEKTG